MFYLCVSCGRCLSGRQFECLLNRLSVKLKCTHAYTCMLQTLATTKEPCTCPMTRTQKESVPPARVYSAASVTFSTNTTLVQVSHTHICYLLLTLYSW